MRSLAFESEASLGSSNRAEKLDLLRTLSTEKKKHWPNTLEAIRNKKLNNKQEREEKKELQMREIDRQEAEFRRSERLEAIQKANELLYEQTDKMKFLRTQQHYADVIIDRRKQMEEHLESKRKEQVREAEAHAETMRQVEEARLKELQAIQAREKRSEMVARSRAEQLQEVQRRKEREREEQRRLGESLKEAAELRLKEESEAREKKAVDIREARIKTLQFNAELREEKRRLQTVEAEAEKEREAALEKIADRKRAKENLEKYRFEQAQKTRQKMIDNAVELLAKKLSNDDEIAAKQQNEFDTKLKAKSDASEAKSKKQWEDTVESRLQMVLKKKKNKEREREESLREAELFRTHAALELSREMDLKLKTREEVRAIKREQLLDAAERKKAAVEAKLIDRERIRLLLKLNEGEKEKFNVICRGEIEKNKAEGKPIVTLLRALRFEQPELIPALVNKKQTAEVAK